MLVTLEIQHSFHPPTLMEGDGAPLSHQSEN